MGPDAVAILMGQALVSRSNDTDYPFRQDSDFWYLTGFDHPGAVAVLRTDADPAYTLYVEPRDPAAETWTGYRPGIEGAVADYAADEAYERSKFLGDLPRLIEKARHVHHVLGRDTRVDECITKTIEELRRRSRQGVSPPEAIIDPRAIVHEMRLIKEPAEIDIMRRAAAISAEAHGAAARLAQPGAYEYELQAVIEYTFRRRGTRGAAYSTIVGGGRNGTILHYVTNQEKLADRELVLIDAGAELESYASDVTRTYPVGGRFEGAGRAVYEVVLASQEAARAAAGPGATLPAVHEAALRVLVDGMVSLQLLDGTVDDLIKEESYRAYYMHGTSHWLGLDVHDAGNYSHGADARKLEAGMAFTIEPGLYIPSDDEKAPEQLRGIGVRIEDDVVINSDGFENFNSSIPKKPADLEALVRG